jgi:hypothetical protein
VTSCIFTVRGLSGPYTSTLDNTADLCDDSFRTGFAQVTQNGMSRLFTPEAWEKHPKEAEQLRIWTPATLGAASKKPENFPSGKDCKKMRCLTAAVHPSNSKVRE